MKARPIRPKKAVVNARVEEVLRIRLDGAEFIDIREYIISQQQTVGSRWESAQPLSDSQVRRYQLAADKLIAQTCHSSRKRLLRLHLARRRNLYAKAVSMGDLRVALSCLQDEAALLKLYPEKGNTLEVFGKVKNDVSITIQSPLTAADIDFARRLLGVADSDVPPDSGPKPLDSLDAPREAAVVLALD